MAVYLGFVVWVFLDISNAWWWLFQILFDIFIPKFGVS